MTPAIEKLRSVLCDPEGQVCIKGTDADRLVITEALEELQAENKKAWGAVGKMAERLAAVLNERNELAAAIEEKNAALISLEEALDAIDNDEMLKNLILCDAEPVGEIEAIDVDEDAQPSAWIRINTDVELGDQLYAPRRTAK